jgi:hypothetical protein
VVNATYNSFWVGNESCHRGKGLQQAIGFPNNPNNGTLPRIDFGETVNGYWMDNLGWPGNGPYWWHANVYDDKVDWIKGSHTISFGGEYRALAIANVSQTGGLNFFFSNATTGAPTQNYSDKVGYGYASFLLGQVNRAQMERSVDLYGRRKSASLFVEDRWKINPRLMLTFGTNWNYYRALREKYGRWANFDKTKVNSALGVKGAVDYLTSGDQTFEKVFAGEIDLELESVTWRRGVVA